MSKPVILIVDDEPANLSIISQFLTPEYQVRVCKSGEQALRVAVKEPRPDLILLDVMMPGMDGYAVLRHLKENPATSAIPVIFVTALDDATDEEAGLHLGAVDYIAKPVKPVVLLARVRTHLEIKKSRDLLRDQNKWLEAEVARRTLENLLIQNLSLSMTLELAETRDADTGNHIARTQAYVEALGRELQKHPRFASELEEAQLNRIIKATPLHDIGKIGIPDNILLKPGKLTKEEWEVMKTHARLGADVIGKAIEKAQSFSLNKEECARPEALLVLETAQLIASGHHERWDGSGYPAGLSGEEIPLAARLMALADVYDALTTIRVYKKAWTAQEAAEHIIEQKGTQFDPDVVDAFVAVRDAFEAIMKELAEMV